MSDPNVHWDGRQWLRWDGEQWVSDPTIPPPKTKHTGIIVGSIVAVVVVGLLLVVGGVWLFVNRSTTVPAAQTSPSPSPSSTGLTITTVPINTTQDSFTDPVGRDQQITAKTVDQPVSVSGGTRGLYGGTKNETTCDREQLISFLMADPAKGQAWAGVLGIRYDQIPGYIRKLTPMLLRSDTLVTNHGFKDGRATSFTSVLQAGTAVLAGRRGLPVVRCYCGNPLTPAGQTSGVTFTGPTWPGWNPQSITVITQNVTFIDIFVVVDVFTGDEFTRPAGTAGTQDGTETASTPTKPAPTSGSGGTSEQIGDVQGFLNSIMNGDYGAADSYTTSAFMNRYGSSSMIAPSDWGALTSYQINGAYVGDDFVAVYVEEYWEGGYRQSTYYVTKGGGTYIDDADFVDSSDSYTEEPQGDYPSDYPEQYPDNGELPTEEPQEYPTDYPEQYPDNGEYPTEEPTDGAVG